MRPQTIGLIANIGKSGAAELVPLVKAEFEKHSFRVLVEKETASLCRLSDSYSTADLAREAELLVVLGGDGTILNIVAEMSEVMKPIFGINIGSLGFLTCAGSTAYQEAVACIAAGKIELSQRTLLEVEVDNPGTNDQILRCLNDAVFSRGQISRLIRLQVRVDGEVLTEFNADGLIIATPTGSTAYSLSAGGPILAPSSGSFVITPICPHVLTNRSIIIDDRSEIEIQATERDNPVYLTLDGREPLQLESGAIVRVRKDAKALSLAALPGVSFFSVVRQKLKWRGSNV